jgi:hypothetical protein
MIFRIRNNLGVDQASRHRRSHPASNPRTGWRKRQKPFPEVATRILNLDVLVENFLGDVYTPFKTRRDDVIRTTAKG